MIKLSIPIMLEAFQTIHQLINPVFKSRIFLLKHSHLLATQTKTLLQIKSLLRSAHYRKFQLRQTVMIVCKFKIHRVLNYYSFHNTYYVLFIP